MDTTHPRRQRMMRNAGILLGVFLLGLIPPLIRSMQLSRELKETQSQLELSRTRDMASLTYLEVSRNNFGIAAQHASTLYDRLRSIASDGEEPAKSVAAGALEKRDAVMSKLATADPAARAELQELTSRLLQLEGESSTRTRSR